MSLYEARKRLQTEVALVRLLKALAGQPGYDLAAMKAEAQATLDACNEDPPAILVPDGYVALPIEPTEEMIRGAGGYGVVEHVLRCIYRDFLAASPYPPEGLETTKG